MRKYSIKNIFDVLRSVSLHHHPPHIYAYPKSKTYESIHENFSISGMDSSLNYFGFFLFAILADKQYPTLKLANFVIVA